MPYQRGGGCRPECRGWTVFNASTMRQDTLTPVSQAPAVRVRAGAAALVPGQVVPMVGERVTPDDEPC